MKAIYTTIKWALVLITTFVVLIFAYLNYVILSFDTQTLTKNHGKVQTQLFLSESNNQPLIVGVGGADGGNGWASEHGKKQRKLLHDNGYAFLAVAYFGADGTPQNLDRIAIDGVHKAVMEAAQNPRINANCIAVMGVSRGSELALLLGSHYKEYKNVIGIVPGSAVFAAMTDAMTTPAFSYNQTSLPFVPVPWSAAPSLLSGDLRAAFEKMMENTVAMEEAAIAVENINGPVMFVSGTSDEEWPSMEMSDAMMKRLDDNHFRYTHKHLALQGGHNEWHDDFAAIITFLNEHLQSEKESNCMR